MAAPRFFVGLDLAPTMVGQMVDLPDAAFHHATRVVRLAAGDSLMLWNGEGGEYEATIMRIDRRGALVRIQRFDPVERESPLAVTLAQAIVASDAMDYAIRKATELGVTAIQPLITARSAPFPAGERGAKRQTHWWQVAIGACEQCGRNRVPEISAALPLGDWLKTWRGAGIALVRDAQTGVEDLTKPTGPIALLIGPEGGWISAETHAASKSGFAEVRFGPRVLRSETAGIAVLSAMQVLWGDCG
jgi:16S rRNA (uracil1498-N3)-methyltransferase